MKLRMIMGIGAAGAIGLAGCDAEKTAEDTRGLKLTVAPLNLAGIDFACYDILVENQGPTYKVVGDGNDVVVLGDPTTQAFESGEPADTAAICSDDYGNADGGGITYIAPCDASLDADTGADDGVQNRVTLWVDGLYVNNLDVSDDPAQAWQNPCPDGCDLDFDCEANADTLVEFNFTIMRNAQQGFFDVAVNFEDVFCSAKVDCQYEGGQYIRLVHDQAGDRTFTAVAAVACTGGDAGATDTDDQRTHLYAADLSVSCQTGATSFEVDGEGNFFGPGDARPAGIEQVMIFRGLESLNNNASGADADKMYWNVAVGFTENDNSTLTVPDLAGVNCQLDWSVTASKGPIDAAFAKDNVTYPYIQASVPITNGVGGAACGQHPVNGGNGVSTVYTGLGDSLPEQFVWHMFQDGGDSNVSSYPAP